MQNNPLDTITFEEFLLKLNKNARNSFVRITLIFAFIIVPLPVLFLTFNLIEKGILSEELIWLAPIYICIIIIYSLTYLLKAFLPKELSSIAKILRKGDLKVIWVYPRKTTYKYWGIVPFWETTELSFHFYPAGYQKMPTMGIGAKYWIEYLKKIYPQAIFGYNEVLNHLYFSDAEKFARLALFPEANTEQKPRQSLSSSERISKSPIVRDTKTRKRYNIDWFIIIVILCILVFGIQFGIQYFPQGIDFTSEKIWPFLLLTGGISMLTIALILSIKKRNKQKLEFENAMTKIDWDLYVKEVKKSNNKNDPSKGISRKTTSVS
jgi:hypothetical protein